MKHEEEGGVRYSWEPNMLKPCHMHLLNEHESPTRYGFVDQIKFGGLPGMGEGGDLSKGVL